MEKKLTDAEKLKLKYHKTEEVTNFKDMLYNSAKNYHSRTAFKEPTVFPLLFTTLMIAIIFQAPHSLLLFQKYVLFQALY